ncbi:uncharacterized protein K452DRAFT_281495, partial [Aplosporella prunicola CBS 121167]
MAPVLLRLLKSSEPTLEALFEIVFREAILSENISVVHTIATNSKINLDEALPGPWKKKDFIFRPYWCCLPLEAAIMLKSVPLVQTLLEAGASVDSTTEKGFTMTHVAARDGTKEILEILLDTGKGDLASAFLKLTAGDTALTYAAGSGNVRMAGMLLAAGAEVNACAASGETALYCAARNSDIGMADLLLQWGADPEGLDYEG